MYYEMLRELDRQIDLTEEFLKQRNEHAKYDTDLASKLRELRDEKAQLLRTGPFEDVSEGIAVD